MNKRKLKRSKQSRKARRTRLLMCEMLEDRRVLAAGWHNPIDALDVNNDRFISAIDVLQIINDINSFGSRSLDGPKDSLDWNFVDTTGDDFVSPIDVLQVINAINQGYQFSSSGFVLKESATSTSEMEVPIQLGQTSGSRTYSFEVRTNFESADRASIAEDTFAVYLAEPVGALASYLVGNWDGASPIFSISGTATSFVPGLVRFDGKRVDVDLSTIQGAETGKLIFQLLNTDSDFGSFTGVQPLGYQLDPEGTTNAPFSQRRTVVAPSVALDLAAMTPSADLNVTATSLAYDASVGAFRGQIQLSNGENTVGRNVAVAFPGLPAGVSLRNASGTTAQGVPYVNFRDAISSGGLGRNSRSAPIEVLIDSPENARFSLAFETFVGQSNRAPNLDPIDPITLYPGEVASVRLNALDQDSDTIRYSLTPSASMPTTRLQGDGTLVIAPGPNQVGNYEFVVSASDGMQKSSRTVSVTVAADPVTSTRISGQVLDVDGAALVGMQVEIGGVSQLTDTNGRFTLDLGSGPIVSETLRIRGDLFASSAVYPFIAEKLPLVLDHEVYAGQNNHIIRPIYLPKLDVAGGTAIDPLQDTTVTQSIASGETATVLVKSGTLLNQQGTPFTSVLSITEVPLDRTPAALPPGLFPDVVVTIQPGEMSFMTPAPLTLPNRAGYAPGEVMDLWSINPTTGDFDNVGVGRVSEDGGTIITQSGGIQNSSWHFFAPPPPAPGSGPSGPCLSCKATGGLTSVVELDSGALREEHRLVTYQSLGSTRGVTLSYGSLQAMPTPILSFKYENVPFVQGPWRLTARLMVEKDGVRIVAQGAQAQPGLSGGEHFWRLPPAGGDLEASIQMDMQSLESGIYDYELQSGFLRVAGTVSGSMDTTEGWLIHVNQSNSAIGAGWSIADDISLIRDSDSRILLLGGNHTALVYFQNPGTPESFLPSVEDYTTINVMPDGKLKRMYKDQSAEIYSADGALLEKSDKNGNTTTFSRDSDNRLVAIIDPVGLTTNFEYSDNLLSTITDPAGRITRLTHDPQGNLATISDPDGATRRFSYNSHHQMVGEIDANSNEEFATYGPHGRIIAGTRKDGTELSILSKQAQVFFDSKLTTSVELAPLPRIPQLVETVFQHDASGAVTVTQLDEFGRSTVLTDKLGNIERVIRNGTLVAQTIDARGNSTEYEYDDYGNVISITDQVVRSTLDHSPLFPSRNFATGRALATDLDVGDLNGDGFLDVVATNDSEDSISILIGNGTGNFTSRTDLALGIDYPNSLTLADFNGDSILDVAAIGANSRVVRLLFGDGEGGFPEMRGLSIGTFRPESVIHGDFNGDSIADIAMVDGFYIYVQIGVGDGRFVFGSRIAREDGTGANILAADLNSDGNDELIASISSTRSIYIYTSNGDGSFESNLPHLTTGRPTSVVAGDIDGDSDVDIVVANSGITILINDGTGVVSTTRTIGATTNVDTVQIEDLNNDGHLDIIAIENNSEGRGYVYLGGTGVSFSEPTTFFSDPNNGAIAVADINLDGLMDVVSANHSSGSNHLSVLLGTPDIGFATRQLAFEIWKDADSLRGGDFNGDGQSDFAYVNTDQNVIYVRFGNETQGFGDAISISVGEAPGQLVVADFNSDGYDDLVSSNFGSQDLTVWYSDTQGGFTDRTTLLAAPTPNFQAHRLAAGDFNGDGRQDFILSDGTTYLNMEHRVFTVKESNVSWGLTRDIDVALLDDDQYADVIVADHGNDRARLYFGSATGDFSPPTAVALGDGPTSILAADFNGDGRPDIASANNRSQDISVALNRGDRTFSVSQSFSVVDDDRTIALATMTHGDFTGDGVVDLAISGLNSVYVLTGLGGGAFSPIGAFSIGFNPFPNGVNRNTFGSIDFNADGLDDIYAQVRGDSANNVVVILESSGANSFELPPAGSRKFTYDSVFNQLTSQTDELGRKTLYTIDPATGDKSEVRMVVGNLDTQDNGETDDIVMTYSYTPAGLIATETDPLGRITEYEYDEFGRLNVQRFAVGSDDEAERRFGYDLAGNQTDHWDENNIHTKFEFDTANRLSVVIQPDPDGDGPLQSPLQRFVYDANGNLKVSIDAEGARIERKFDSMDRVFEEMGADPDGDGPLAAPLTSFVYDRNGNQTQIVGPL